MSNFRKFGDVVGGGNANPLDLDGINVSIEDDPIAAGTVVDNEDGGVSIIEDDYHDGPLPIPADLPFDANLADYISEDELNLIGTDIKEKAEADFESCQPWRDTFNNGLKFLGLKPEDRDWVFKGACGSWDTKLLEALIRFHSEIFPELFPAEGPTKVKILGTETEQLRDQAERVRIFQNFYLTQACPEYYSDSDQMLNYSMLAGSAFRKVYICPLKRRPMAKFMGPDEVAMPYSATSIYDTDRFTHLTTVTKNDLKMLQHCGFYRDIDLAPSMDPDGDFNKQDVNDAAGQTDVQSWDDENYNLYETMIYYDLPRFEHEIDGETTGLALPYKITVHVESGEVLRIEKNWKAPTQDMQALQTGSSLSTIMGIGEFERDLNVSHWQFMPGFGPFGMGLITCLGSSADTRTKLIRILTDSGVFSTFPPTIRVKGMRMERNNAAIRPGENIEMDTAGLPINSAIQQLNVKEPSMMLYQLFQDQGGAADRLIGNMDISVGDGRQDAPVGTTIALLQAAKKPQTGVMRRFHRALTHELRLFFKLFGIWLPDAPYPFPVPGTPGTIMRTDFDDNVAVTPVSDPNVMSQTERMMRSEMIMKTTAALPPTAAPYQIEAARRLFMQMGIENVDKLLPPLPQQAQPQDPVTENQAALNGKPIQAFLQQNHDAHIAVHTPLAEASPAMQAHITEHQAFKYRLMVENQLGFALPPEGAVSDPQVQEQIAMLAARATQQYMDEQAAKNPPKPTVEEIMMADVQQKKDKEILRHVDAQARLKTDEKMAILKSDDDAAERATKLKTAELKSTVDLHTGQDSAVTVAHIKTAGQIEAARIKAGSDDGKEPYDYERSKE